MQCFCCKHMDDAINKYRVIELEEEMRGYFIPTTPNGVVLALFFCPFCGVNLGKRLNAEYFDTLEKEYGIDDPDIINYTNIPDEFKTDEWWRRRGL